MNTSVTLDQILEVVQSKRDTTKTVNLMVNPESWKLIQKLYKQKYKATLDDELNVMLQAENGFDKIVLQKGTSRDWNIIKSE